MWVTTVYMSVGNTYNGVRTWNYDVTNDDNVYEDSGEVDCVFNENVREGWGMLLELMLQ